MLEQFREFANKKIVKWIFAIFLIIPFGLFGIDFYFRGGGAAGDTVATVGRTRVSAYDFDQALRQQTEQLRQQFRGAFDSSLMDTPEMRRSVLDRLVNERVVAVGADKAGLRLTGRALAERIASEPSFQVDGKFSKDRYDAVARANNLTPAGLDVKLAEEFAQQQFVGAIVDSAFIPKTTVDNFIKLSEQSREVAVVNLTPESYMAKVKVGPDQLKSYYDSHPKEFTTPDRARVDYIELSGDALAARETVSPDDVKKAYEANVAAGKYGEPEERRASHILISLPDKATDAQKKAAEAKANQLAAEVRKNPKSFAEIAKKESQDPGSAAQGGDLGFFRRGMMVKPFEDAVFSAKPGEIVGPVQSPFGYHIIRLTEIHPAKVKSFADAAPEIEAALRKSAAQRKLADMTENFSNIVYEQSGSLKPAADALKLPIQQSGWIEKGGPSQPQIFANPKLQAEVFSSETTQNKRNTSAVEIAPGDYVAARIVEHKPAALKPFDTVKADIEKRLQREEALKLAKADGEAKVKALREGKDAGVKFPQPLEVSRKKSGGLFPMVVDRAFRVDARKLPGYSGIETPAGYALVQVTKVIEPQKIDDSQRQAMESQLRQTIVAEQVDAAVASLRDKVGVKVQPGAIDKKQPQS
ncbi:MAG TPA: SurA N-terminal domain-containing protein [Usitatibacter sp.]|jgi:peptidyl-prolyl cis-trans isomerase D|nr:SurA N-terminal domain-containing protein [Usitatibacter sp.]